MCEDGGLGESGVMGGGMRWSRSRVDSTDNGTRDDHGFFVGLMVPVSGVRRSLIDCMGVALCLIRHLDHVS